MFDNPAEAREVGARARQTMVSTYSVPSVAAFVRFHMQRVSLVMRARHGVEATAGTAVLSQAQANDIDLAIRHVSYKPNRI